MAFCKSILGAAVLVSTLAPDARHDQAPGYFCLAPAILIQTTVLRPVSQPRLLATEIALNQLS